MKRYLELKKSLNAEISFKDRFDAFTGAFIYATFILFPFLFMLIEASIVLMYILTLWVILIIIVLFLYIFIMQLFWRKSILLKNPEIKTDTKKIVIYHTLFVNTFILAGGLIFLFVLVPILWK